MLGRLSVHFLSALSVLLTFFCLNNSCLTVFLRKFDGDVEEDDVSLITMSKTLKHTFRRFIVTAKQWFPTGSMRSSARGGRVHTTLWRSDIQGA